MLLKEPRAGLDIQKYRSFLLLIGVPWVSDLTVFVQPDGVTCIGVYLLLIGVSMVSDLTIFVQPDEFRGF